MARSSGRTEAWILGTGLASLASALCLVQHAKLHPSRVHVLDSNDSMEQIVQTGDITHGYHLSARYLPFSVGEPWKKLFASILSSQDEDCIASSGGDLLGLKRDLVKTMKQTRFMIEKEGKLREVPTKSLGLSPRNRLELIWFLHKGEKEMGRKKIHDFLSEAFFQSDFWTIWSTHFGFQPWHSASEFKRVIRQHLRDHERLLNFLDITGYDHESVLIGIFRHLRGLGVDFKFDTVVTGIEITSQGSGDRVSHLDLIENGFQSQQVVDEQDIIIITLGSTISGMATGTNDSPPLLESMDLGREYDENWLLWLEIGDQDTKFGNPYNFCTRRFESLSVTFTITTWDPRIWSTWESLKKGGNDNAILISVPESPWKLSVCLPGQPVLNQQPQNVRVMWGFALHPKRRGKFVNKSMHTCSGAEISMELFKHLDFPLSTQHTVTVPCAMPRMRAMLLARSYNDRPMPVPSRTANIGLVGRFIEIPSFTSAEPNYEVLTAEIAVSNLMGLDMSKPKNQDQPVLDMLRLLFWG